MRAELGVNGTRANDRDANVVGSQFLGYRVGQAIQAPLRGGVGGCVGQGVLACQGRDVNDVPAAGLDHERGEAADAVVHAAQVRVQHAVPIVGRELMEWASGTSGSGIVDENVYAVEGALDALGERFDRMQIGDITFDHGAFLRTLQGTFPGILAAAVPDGGGGLFECFARASA